MVFLGVACDMEVQYSKWLSYKPDSRNSAPQLLYFLCKLDRPSPPRG